MSAPPIPAAPWTWPADVVEFAEHEKVRGYLDALRQAIDRIYPTARSVKVYVSEDPEIRDDRHIVFDVHVPEVDLSDFRAATRRWHDELFRICPAPLAPVFRLLLIVASAPVAPGPMTAEDEAERQRVHRLGVMAWRAYFRDLMQLVEDFPGRYVAYHGDQRLGIAKSDLELYQLGFQHGLKLGEFEVFPIELPQEDYVIDSLPGEESTGTGARA